MSFTKFNKKIKINLILQSVGMLAGTSTHLQWAIKNGFLSEKYNASFPSVIFWDSLTFLDPLAAILLITKPKIGIYLTTVIIIVDVLHNCIFYHKQLFSNFFYFEVWLENNWMILCQILFGFFVVFSFSKNMKEVRSTLMQ